MKAILNKLYQHQQLSYQEAKQVLLGITAQQYSDVEVASFLTVYQMRSISLAEIEGFRDALLERCIPFDLEGMQSIDIVGTGGDGKNTFNISTTSAFVLAGAGYKVSKHGSYGSSSAVGSSNVLQALGYEFTSDTSVLKRQLEQANICFLHAPLFHPALKHVVPVRKQLRTRTFFNMLGPLVNPAQPSHQLLGTFSLELSRLYHYIMERSGRQYAIVYALDGYDELSLTAKAKLKTAKGERILEAADFNYQRLQPSELNGGATAEAAQQIILNVLKNEATQAQKSVVCANVAVAIQSIDPHKSLADCLAEAEESIDSGRAYDVLKKII